jgi:hypothetical protein
MRSGRYFVTQAAAEAEEEDHTKIVEYGVGSFVMHLQPSHLREVQIHVQKAREQPHEILHQPLLPPLREALPTPQITQQKQNPITLPSFFLNRQKVNLQPDRPHAKLILIFITVYLYRNTVVYRP